MFLTSIKTGFLAFIALLASLFSPAPTTYAPPIAPSTPPQISQINNVSTSTPKNPTGTTTAQNKPSNIKPALESQTPTVSPSPNVKPAQAPQTQTIPAPKVPDWNAINERARSATVNVVCTSTGGGLFAPLSGSGVIIDPRGVILTNAHIGQYFLLKDYPAKDSLECLIRQGSPASPRYRAELLYLPSSWVQKHREDILLQSPLSTGENDFALLVITKTTDPAGTLPASFPFLERALIEDADVVGQPVIISAYPAGFLGGVSIQTSLYLSSASATIRDVYTFSSTAIDVLSLGGTVVSQKGSSGGATVDSDGKLVGIIVTSSDAKQTSDRDLRAITLSHIDRSLLQELGVNLATLLSQNILQTAETFGRTSSPILTKSLIEILERVNN